MNIERARERIRQRIETMDKLRGRPLTDVERLENLKAMLFSCDQCEAPIETLLWDFCPWCGWDLKGPPDGQSGGPCDK